jgi:hypothetical protein
LKIVPIYGNRAEHLVQSHWSFEQTGRPSEPAFGHRSCVDSADSRPTRRKALPLRNGFDMDTGECLRPVQRLHRPSWRKVNAFQDRCVVYYSFIYTLEDNIRQNSL